MAVAVMISIPPDWPSTRLAASDIAPARWAELVSMLNPVQLARFDLSIDDLSEKWEAMVPMLDPEHPDDYFLLVGNDNDFIARRCRMLSEICDEKLDSDNRLLVSCLRIPTQVR